MDTLERLIQAEEHPAKTPGARWSQAARCPRMAYYGAIDAPAAEADAETLARFDRGHMHGDWYTAKLVEEHGEENVVREPGVPWPGGILHPDAYVAPLRECVEVKSHTDGGVKEDDLTQLAGQVHYHPEAESGRLVIVDPLTLRSESTALRVTDYWRERVESISDQVVSGLKSGVPPERVCEHPNEARQHLCPHARHCFRDWTPPDPVKLAGELAETARALYVAERQASDLAKATERAKEERDRLRGELRDVIEPGVEYEAGGVKFWRTVSANGVSWDKRLAAARKARTLQPELELDHGPYASERKGAERWTVKATEGFEAPAEDYGDEAPF